jgi:hypothetical protein
MEGTMDTGRRLRTVTAVGIGAASGMLVALAGSRRWQAETDRLVQRLDGLATRPAETVSFDTLASLPPPVRRYFRLVLREGQARIRTARVRQAGSFRSRESGDPQAGWAPFVATQRFTTEPPGFVWDARIRTAPLVSVRVRDGYVGGHATMRGAVAALVPVVNAADTAELRAGALQRYLAEAVWLPTALLPGGRVTWTALNGRVARATLADGETTVSLEFEFGPDGEIVAARTPARNRAVPGKPGEYILAPWGGRFARYEEHGGMLVPTESEVYWVIEGREQPYYRGRNLDHEYGFGAPNESV